MNNKSIALLFIVIATILLAMMMLVAVLDTDGNAVADFSKYAAIATFFFGLLKPKYGIYCFVLLCGYSDLIKRAMVMDISISKLDVMWVLSMAPICLAGIVTGILIQLIKQKALSKPAILRFTVATILSGLSGVAAILSGEGLGSLRMVVDYGAFTYLVFVLPEVFSERKSIVSFSKRVLLIFLPVALYGVYQRVLGLSDFEYEYLLTGLSIESRQLDEVQLRPFSTLNAASSLTMVCAAGAMMSMLLMRDKYITKVYGCILFSIYTIGCFMTYTRTGWVCLTASLILIFIYRSKYIVVAMYTGAITCFIALVWNAELLVGHLHGFQEDIYNSVILDGSGEQALRITTLKDRFVGFENLKNPSNWTLFGVSHEGVDIETEGAVYTSTFSHDMLSRFIIQRGVVPFAIVFIIVSLFFYKLHRTVFLLKLEARRLPLGVIAVLIGLSFSVMTGGYLFQFPANLYFWLLVSIVLVSFNEEKKLIKDD